MAWQPNTKAPGSAPMKDVVDMKAAMKKKRQAALHKAAGVPADGGKTTIGAMMKQMEKG